MTGVDLKKEWEDHKSSNKSAENLISQGYAEYVEETKKITSPEEAKFEALVGTINRTPDYFSTKGDLRVQNIPEELWERLAERCEAVKEALNPSEEKEEGLKENAGAIFGVAGQVKRFYEIQPFFYDRAGIFFVWDNEAKKYDKVDDIDMLNGVAGLGVDTISNKSKSEIVNALKQYGRLQIPETAPLSWIQFKDKIYDFKTNEEFEASHKYFITSPIPHSPSDSEETPMIDKLFKEWVGEDYVETLHEILSYAACSDQFMQRMIALVGGGSNGKGTYIKLLNRFIGNENTTTSELKELCTNTFETSMIYKKLVCFFGEIMHGDLQNSNRLKTLAGEDQVRFCFKGKTPFKDDSITTLICATNSLPRTPDKTMGFYRKWLIVDFPNQFEAIEKDVLGEIPEEEYNNLARRTLNTIKKLYASQKFTNEGSFEKRMQKYEERSNPIMTFINQDCEEDYDSYVSLKDFSIKVNQFVKTQHMRPLSVKEIKRTLQDEGYDISRTTKNYRKDNYILCLKFKDCPNYPDYPQNTKLITRGEVNRDLLDKVDKVDNELKIEVEKI